MTTLYRVQEGQKALPHLVEPHDTLRLGLCNLKDQASISHPVEAIQLQVRGLSKMQVLQ